MIGTKKIKCAICGEEMTVSASAVRGFCSRCIMDGSFARFRAQEREEKEKSLMAKFVGSSGKEAVSGVEVVKTVPEKEKLSNVNVETASEVFLNKPVGRTVKKPSRSSLIKELFSKGFCDAEILAEVKKQYPDVKERLLKTHISAEKSDLRKKGLLKEKEVILSSETGTEVNEG